MVKIGGGQRPPNSAEGADLQSQEGVQKFREAAEAEGVPKAVADQFVRGGAQIAKQLETLSGKALAGKLQFSTEELARIAAQFAVVLKQYPRADRKERARMFSKAVVKHKRISKLFEDVPEEEAERFFEWIAEQLDGAPVFAQLVDEVTEGAKKISLG